MPKAPFTISNRFLTILAHHLFGDNPAVVLRELIQNAHDAVLMRAATDAGLPRNAGVRIIVDRQAKTLTILDSGVGMTQQDIAESLTCLGAGAKESDKIQALMKRVQNPDMLKNVAGYFGFGFVASMMVSDRVEIWTRQKGAKGVYCRFDVGEEQGTFEEGNPPQMPDVGTKVVLHIDMARAAVTDDTIPQAKGGDLLHVDTVERILQKYCDLMEFEIHLGPNERELHLVNQRQAPWEGAARPTDREMMAYFTRRFGEGLNKPLDYVVFRCDRAQHGIEASGVLYVPRPAIGKAISEAEKLEIFVKRIWICDNDQGLLPEWARFMRGVIVSPDLMVSIDRRGLDKLDRSYHAMANALRDFISTYLIGMAEQRPQDFRALLELHDARLRGGLLVARGEMEGPGPTWFKDLLRLLPFRVYSRKYPTGHDASINELLGFNASSPLVLKPNGEKHLLQGVNRVIAPTQASEFRKVIADKTDPIIVPESRYDWLCLGLVGKEFEAVLQIADVEFTFSFVEPLPPTEQDRWDPFVQFISQEMLQYDKSPDLGRVNVGNIRKTELPMLLHWKDKRLGENAEMPPRDDLRDQFLQITTINAANPFMRDLLKFVEEHDIRRLDTNSTVGNCLFVSYYLALLEQNASLREKVFDSILFQTISLMSRQLSSERELDGVKTHRDQIQSDMEKAVKEIERFQREADRLAEIPATPEKRHAAIVFVDLVDSTGNVLMDLDFTEQGYVFGKYASALKKLTEDFGGLFDKFTGDGGIALFGVLRQDSNPAEACLRAVQFARQASVLTAEFGQQPDIASKLNACLGIGLGPVLGCRVALTCGPVNFGRFGASPSVVGVRMVEAARICADKELFDRPRIVATRPVYAAMGAPHEWTLVKDDYVPRGLAHKIDLFAVV